MHITAIAPHNVDIYIGDIPEAPRIPLGVCNSYTYRCHTSGLIANNPALLVLQQRSAEARQCHV